jgi:hypothetical protein
MEREGFNGECAMPKILVIGGIKYYQFPNYSIQALNKHKSLHSC